MGAVVGEGGTDTGSESVEAAPGTDAAVAGEIVSHNGIDVFAIALGTAHGICI